MYNAFDLSNLRTFHGFHLSKRIFTSLRMRMKSTCQLGSKWHCLHQLFCEMAMPAPATEARAIDNVAAIVAVAEMGGFGGGENKKGKRKETIVLL
ncbi:hypothetical protein BUALT_Bualt02G0219200 [Buddleja alternifolia]|uniref:Uncharacterized protein n=1 Tax=Buddleja alternifolia TaxID=168488 RepID=A0AAV6Y921_9LAMI|nr:hypothetical protein BUALT_Bualt02G0219200 [Buddleja alternifolia]